MRAAVQVVILLASLVVSATSCSHNDASTLATIERDVRGWSSTLRLTSEQLSAQRVTPSYARQISQAAVKDLRSQAGQLARLAPDTAGKPDVEVRLESARRDADALERQAAGR